MTKNKKISKAVPSQASKMMGMLFLAVAVFFAFSPCLSCGLLHWDDGPHFYGNPYIYSLSWPNLCNIFLQTVNHTYIPLTTLSFNLEYHLFGLSPLPAHLINVLLHIAIVLVIFNLAMQMGFLRQEAFIAALLFGLHPLHVESVAWVTERKDVLSILFYMLCLKQYWSYLENHSSRHYGLSLLFAVLSVLTKSMAVSIPWVLLLMDWFYKRRFSREVLLEKIPFTVLVFSVAAVTFFTLSPHPQIHGSSLLIGLWSFSWYLEKFVLPFNLIPAYAPPVPVAFSNFVYLKSFLIFMAFLVSLWLGRKNRLFVFACLFWVFTIFFFWRFDFKDNNVVADRFMYLPSLGFCLLLARYLSAYKILPLALACFWGILTFAQCHVWQNDLTLWSWTIQNDPKNVIAKLNVSRALYDPSPQPIDYKGLSRLIDQNPDNAGNYLKRGEALLQDKEHFSAFSDFNRAISLDPSNDVAYLRRGQLYALSGDDKKALEDFHKAMSLKPDNALVYLQMATLYEVMRQNSQAMIWLDKAASIDPAMGAVYFERGQIYYNARQYQKAISEFTRAITLHNQLKNSYYRRAKSYEALKQFDRAEIDFKMALQNDPYDVDLFNELGDLYLREGKDSQALKIFNKAIALYPYYDNAYNNRGIIYIHQKKYDLAIHDYTLAIRLALYPYHALITRGDLYFAMGQSDKARADYKTAVIFSQGDPIAKMRLEQLKNVFLSLH